MSHSGTSIASRSVEEDPNDQILRVNINCAVVEDRHNLGSTVASANKGIREAAHDQLREVGIVSAVVTAHVLTLTQVPMRSLPRLLGIRALAADGLEQANWYGHVLSTDDDPSLLARRYRPHGHRDELSLSKPKPESRA